MSAAEPASPPAISVTRRDRAVLAILSFAVLLPGTFDVSLVDRDEGWYAQVSREMLDTGDWLVPHYLGQPWIAKPPLLYWCAAASFAVFGVRAWAARLVSVLAMAVAVQLVATLGSELYNRRVALLAACSFVTAGLPVIVGKMVLTDALLLACCLAATVLLWRITTRGPTSGRSLGFWLFVGLAILAKGPAVLVFVGAFALGLVVIAWRHPSSGKVPVPPTAGRGGPALLPASFWLACPVCFAVAAPWYVYVALGAGGTFWQQFMGYEIVSRLIGAPHGHAGPPGYYVLLSLAGWLPWTVLVPGAVFEAWRARRDDRVARLLLIWCGVPWLFLELIPSKLPHYILPCYVPLAILFGRMWDIGLQQAVTSRQRLVLALWAGVPMALGAMLLVTAVIWHELAWSLAAGIAGAILLAGFALVGWLARQRRLWPAWVSAVGVIALFHVVAGVWVLPGFEPYRLSRQIAAQANALCGPNSEVLVCGYTEPTVFFYLRRPARVVSAAEVSRAVAEPDAARVLIVREPEAQVAGLTIDRGQGWHRLEGFNYVKGRRETVWITRHPP